MKWDFFISHAHEDKDEIARPLAEMLKSHDYHVWYDEYSLKMGDELRASIEKGLRGSRYGVVILSPNFFAKKWTKLELDGLFQLEGKNEKRILPVWHGVTLGEVQQYSLILANRHGVPSSKGLDHVVTMIIEAMQKEDEVVLTQDDHEPSIVLHPRSIEMLEAAKNSDGWITAIRDSEGFIVSTGGFSSGMDKDPRTDALNLYCLEELVCYGLLDQKNATRFVLSQEGYDYTTNPGFSDVPHYSFKNITNENLILAIQIMQAAVASDGLILFMYLNGHKQIQIDGKYIGDIIEDRRSEARAESVINELEENGLLTHVSKHLYRVTHLGYIWTDALNLRNGTGVSAT